MSAPVTTPTPVQDSTGLEERILGSLTCAAIGDALGAPTEQRSVLENRRLFGHRVEEFFEPPADSPYAVGRRAGQITDDSSQMFLLAEAFIANGGAITARAVADMLLTWSKTEYYPRFAGPSTRRAIDALRAGADPETLGAQGRETNVGTTNGGSMRVAPAGLVHPGDPTAAVHAAAVTCMPSHFTSIGVSGAGAIAAAVSIAVVNGSTIVDVVRAAIRGARLGADIGAKQGREVAGANVADRIEAAVAIGLTSPDIDTAIELITARIGTGLPTVESVPAAIGFFVAANGDPWQTVVAAATAGDDSDTVGCMAGSVAGAFRGIGAIPTSARDIVRQANGLDLESLASRLTRVAQQPRGNAHL